MNTLFSPALYSMRPPPGHVAAIPSALPPLALMMRGSSVCSKCSKMFMWYANFLKPLTKMTGFDDHGTVRAI